MSDTHSTPAAPATGSTGESSPTPQSAQTSGGSAPGSANPPPDGGKGASSTPGADNSRDTSFDFMGEIFGDDGNKVTPPATPAQAEPTAAQPATPAPQPPPDGKTPPAPVAKPAEPAAQTPAPAAEPVVAQPSAAEPSPQLDPGNPIQLARALGEHSAAAIEQLATGPFKLTQQDIEALDADITTAIPRIMAKTAVLMQQQFLTQLGNIVPRMIQGQQKQVEIHEKNAARFYHAWPSIDRVKHGDLVTQLGIRYRQMFPQNSLEQMIQDLGPLVMSAAKIPLSPMNAGSAPVAVAAAVPGKPASPNGFVPASPGTVVQQTPVEDNPFGYMGQQG